VVIPVGLAILATEYAWARRWLRKVRRVASDVVSGREGTSIRDTLSSSHYDEHEKRAADRTDD
jgi:Putative transmembrane protein (PGPGW)